MQPDHISDATSMAAISDGPGSREADGADEFDSLASARAYVASIGQSICSLGETELAAALSGIGTAYQQFPELVLEYPIEDFLEKLSSTAADLKVQTLALLVAYLSTSEPKPSMIPQLLALTEEKDGRDTFFSGLSQMLDCRDIAWSPMEKLIEPLLRQGRADKVLQLLSAALGHIDFPDELSRLAFEDVLRWLLDLPRSPHDEPGSLVKLALAARDRLNRGVTDSTVYGAAGMLVDTADRLRRLLSPVRPDVRPVVAWPGGRLTFEEFLLQWPCTIELPIELEQSEFIEEAYRAILLRDPGPDEMRQHLKLMKEGASKVWIIEDLLGCEELHRLDRQLRVSLGDCVITEPNTGGGDNNPTVTWPVRIVL